MGGPAPFATILVAAAALSLTSCGSAGGTDRGPADLPDVPADPGLDLPPDPGLDVPADLPPADDGSVLDDHGFRVRIPRERVIPTEGPGGQTGWTSAWDLDWMCTFRHGGQEGVLYLQDRPLKDRGWILGGITWQTDGAWMSSGGVPTPVRAAYDSGGNHRNDWIRLEYGGAVYRYWHSSMGVAWRKCQAPDCLQVLDPADAAVTLEDGCTPARGLPVWCVEVGHDGSVPPLEDGFHTCPGDPNG